MIRAVLFDLDGTLLNTIDGIALAMNTVLEKHNFPLHSVEEYKKLVGKGVPNLVKKSCPSQTSVETLSQCLKEMETEYERSWQQRTFPYDGVLEMIEALHEKKIILSILSNKPDELTRTNVMALLPFKLFSDVRGAVPDVPVKPAPDGALDISRQVGIAPENWLYLGDTDTDMQTARAAGMYPVGAAWGFRDIKELMENGAETVIKRPTELVALIEKINKR